jgi:hypothetical protein
MKPGFMATALPPTCHKDTERTCHVVALCFPEALPPPLPGSEYPRRSRTARRPESEEDLQETPESEEDRQEGE